VKRYEEEQREKEMGPGGLHPADVMETLPSVRLCHFSEPWSFINLTM